MIGTFALVFCGTGAIVINEMTGGAVSHAGVALTLGLIVLAMIYAVGDVSGANLNAAVTVGFWLGEVCRGAKVLHLFSAKLSGRFVRARCSKDCKGTKENSCCPTPDIQ